MLDTLSQQLRSPAAKKARQTTAAAHMERLARQTVAAAAREPPAALQAAEEEAVARGQLVAAELRAGLGVRTDTAPAAQPREVVSAEEGPAQKRGGAAGEPEQARPMKAAAVEVCCALLCTKGSQDAPAVAARNPPGSQGHTTLPLSVKLSDAGLEAQLACGAKCPQNSR